MSANDASDCTPWTRSARVAFAALVLAASASLLWLVHPYYEATTGTNDGSMYIISARALLAGEGYAYLGRPFTVRPPGMSVAIAPLIAWRGLDFHALNFLVSAFGVAGIAALFALVRPRLGTWLALAVAASLWLNPAYQHMCNQVMSDVPGTALLLACLLVERWTRRAPSWRRDVLLGIAIALAAYMRTINVLLVPAIVGARVLAQWTSARASDAQRFDARAWLRFALTRLAPLALTAWLLLLPWSIRNERNAPPAPVDQNYIYSYSSGMWNVDVGDPSSPHVTLGAVLERVPKRGRQILTQLGSALQQSAGKADDFGRSEDSADSRAPAIVAGAVLLALALGTLLVKRRASELMLFGALAVLSIYFGFQDRLVLPIYVLALPAALEMLALLGARFAPGGARFASIARARVALAVLVGVLALVSFKPRAGWEQIAATHAAYERFCAEIARALPPDARVAASIGWHDSVYLDRPVYSLLFAMRRSGSASGAERVIDAYGIDTVIIAPPEKQLLAYFQKRYGNAQLTSDGGALVRVRK